MGLDGRIGRKFLHPGPGFGGSCFPKDTLAMARIGQDNGAPQRLVETVVTVNDARKSTMARRVILACGGSVRGKRIAVWGLTFKPETDDMRDAPSIPIVSRLVEDGAELHVFDPEGMEQARPHLPPQVIYATDPIEAVTGADALVVVTEWNLFRAVAPTRLKALMRGSVIVDLRNIFDPAAIRAAGFAYHAIGRALPPIEEAARRGAA
jgi:UDPglucose 6-dehydrogenase